MAINVDLKIVIEHIINGTLADELCRVCLRSFDENSENIFSKICKGDKEYCIADVFENVCQIKIEDTENWNVCSDCFITASAAYKFYLTSKRSTEILNFYITELEYNLKLINIPEEITSETLCISLPVITTETQAYDYDFYGPTSKDFDMVTDYELDRGSHSYKVKKEKKTNEHRPKYETESQNENLVDIKREIDPDDIIIVLQENDKTLYYKREEKDTLVPCDEKECDNLKNDEDENFNGYGPVASGNKKRRRKKRGPMRDKMCTKCPVRYRYSSKLIEHMKADHNVDLILCKICKSLIEGKEKFHNHVKIHAITHICNECGAMFRRRTNIITHLRKHTERNVTEGSYICEICGQIQQNEEQLQEHCDKKHHRKFNCHYCGKMYKSEISLDVHIKKHEIHMRSRGIKLRRVPYNSEEGAPESEEMKKERYDCNICGRSCVDERALLWHRRLHTNEKPYVCEVCGRAFVSLNRRKQHMTCAHSAPTWRCPLCPALFHLRSMVNTHIKKVHLKSHKRRNRTSKYKQVAWRTETVPIQDLSIAIQSDVIELQAALRRAQGH